MKKAFAFGIEAAAILSSPPRVVSSANAQSLKQNEMIFRDREKVASPVQETNQACETQIAFQIDCVTSFRVCEDDNNQRPWAYLADATDALTQICPGDGGKQIPRRRRLPLPGALSWRQSCEGDEMAPGQALNVERGIVMDQCEATGAVLSMNTAVAKRQRSASMLIFAAVALTTAFHAMAAQGGPPSFSYKDWEVACDNTRTCRAAGYQSEGGDSEPASIRLTRSAGPATAVEIDLQVGGEKAVRGPLSLKAETAEVRDLGTEVARLSRAQANSLLPQLLRAEQAVVTSAGGERWVISLLGLNAVLLKMDEAQGRIDTPGALVKRGGRPESSVLPPLPVPMVKAVRPRGSRPGDAALAGRIFPKLDLREAKETCNQAQRVDAQAIVVNRLTDAKVLLSLECGVGAYNDQSFLWIADDKPPYSARQIEATGGFDAKDGSVTSVQKGRGIADCVWLQEAQFDGQGFVLTREAGDTMCRGFAGGAWNLPRYVSRVEYAPTPR